MKKKSWLILSACLIAAMIPIAADEILDLAIGTAEPSRAKLLLAEIRTRGGPKADLYAGIVLHNIASADPAKTEEAIALLKAYWERMADPLALGYYGSAMTLRGSVLSAKGDMMGAAVAVDAGFTLMDRAVALAPKDATIRFLRAENGLGVAEASPFKRYDLIAEDIKALEQSTQAADPETRSHRLLISGRLSQARGKLAEAIKAYELAVKAAPRSAAAAEARARLARLEE